MTGEWAGLGDVVRTGARVAVGDGAGAPASCYAALSAAARRAGGVELLLGWAPASLAGLELDAFAGVRCLMAGYELRRPVDEGRVRYLPLRLGTAPSFLRSVWRPDVLVASVVREPDGHHFATEVAWQRAAVAAGAVVAAVERPRLPACDAGEPLPADRVVVMARSDDAPTEVRWGRPGDEHRRVAANVARLVPVGCRLQFGPGAVGDALLELLDVPVHVDTGIVTDGVARLDRRGLLCGTPLAAYVAGTAPLYRWARGKRLVDGVERTHDPGRLRGGLPLVAVNTGLEIDEQGQVNVERVPGSAVAGIGGQPDYAAAAAAHPDGLSIVALPTRRGGSRTLVDRLCAPASTPAHDVDVVVTERGAADLRGLDRDERRRALAALWA